MSEPQHDERADKPRSVDEVVDSVNASLAEAEAASRQAVADDRDQSSASRSADEVEIDVEERAPGSDEDAVETVVVTPWDGRSEPDDEPTMVYAVTEDEETAVSPTERYPMREGDATAVQPIRDYDDPTQLYPTWPDDPVPSTVATVTPSEPILPVEAAPVFLETPVPPRMRGNRGAAGAIGILAAISFAALYLGTALGLRLLFGEASVETLGPDALAALTSWWLWVPVALFFLSFWLLGAIVNRGPWGAWVVLGVLIGLVSYGGHLLGQLFEAPFWAVSVSQGVELVRGQLLAPLAIAAFVIGRELTVWFGAWAAARGRAMSELNRARQEDYERSLRTRRRMVQD